VLVVELIDLEPPLNDWNTPLQEIDEDRFPIFEHRFQCSVEQHIASALFDNDHDSQSSRCSGALIAVAGTKRYSQKWGYQA
jgi:hypothetical protein